MYGIGTTKSSRFNGLFHVSRRNGFELDLSIRCYQGVTLCIDEENSHDGPGFLHMCQNTPLMQGARDAS